MMDIDEDQTCDPHTALEAAEQSFDALITARALIITCGKFLAEDDPLMKALKNVENNVNETGKTLIEDTGRATTSRISIDVIEHMTKVINEEFTLAIGYRLKEAIWLLTEYCRNIDGRGPRHMTLRARTHRNIEEICIVPAKEAMAQFMRDETKAQFLEMSLGALFNTLKRPADEEQDVPQKLRRAQIQAAKTNRLLVDLEVFFRDLREGDGCSHGGFGG